MAENADVTAASAKPGRRMPAVVITATSSTAAYRRRDG